MSCGAFFALIFKPVLVPQGWFGTLSPAENPHSFPLVWLLLLAQPIQVPVGQKHGDGTNPFSAFRKGALVLVLGTPAVTQIALGPSDLEVSASFH